MLWGKGRADILEPALTKVSHATYSFIHVPVHNWKSTGLKKWRFVHLFFEGMKNWALHFCNDLPPSRTLALTHGLMKCSICMGKLNPLIVPGNRLVGFWSHCQNLQLCFLPSQWLRCFGGTLFEQHCYCTDALNYQANEIHNPGQTRYLSVQFSQGKSGETASIWPDRVPPMRARRAQMPLLHTRHCRRLCCCLFTGLFVFCFF